MQGCPGWSPWTDWTNCTAPCGGGFRERERQCLVDGVRYKLLQTYIGFMVNVYGRQSKTVIGLLLMILII